MVLRHLRFALLVFCAALFGAQPTLAASPSIDLQARTLASGEVRLKVSVSAANALRGTRVEILRGDDDGALLPYIRISNPGSSQTLFDAPTQDGIYSYRAKISGRIKKGRYKGRKFSARSKVTAVFVELPSDGTGNPPGGDNPNDIPPAIQLGAGISRCPASFAQDLLNLVNSARSQNGLGALSLDDHLNWAAEKHSNWMMVSNTFSHDNWYEEIIESGFQGTSFGQNIAALGYPTPASVMDGWMNSPGHRANILKSSYGHMGVSCLQNSAGTRWWTQDFGS